VKEVKADGGNGWFFGERSKITVLGVSIRDLLLVRKKVYVIIWLERVRLYDTLGEAWRLICAETFM